jgi:dolichyl-phosphate beta-glucosyltransferase
MKRHDLSVIIPVYREERRIIRCINETAFFFKHNKRIRNYDIIFIADKSGDRTIEIIREAIKQHPRMKLVVNTRRLHKGGSVRKGMLMAKYDPMMFFDADLSTPLYEIDSFLDMIDDYDVLIGSRALKDSKVEKKWYKTLMSKTFSLFKWVVLGLNVKDTQCGFKMYRKKCKKLFEMQQMAVGTFDIEIILMAKRNGFRLKEVPVTWVDVDMSNFNTIQIAAEAFVDVLRMKRNDLAGKYTLK